MREAGAVLGADRKATTKQYFCSLGAYSSGMGEINSMSDDDKWPKEK